MRCSASFAFALAALLSFSGGRAHAEPPTALPPLEDFPSGFSGPSAGIPAGWRDPSAGKEMWSGGMVASGIVLLSLGVTLLPIGTIVSAGARPDCVSDPTGVLTCTPSAERMTGLGMLIGAAGALAIGIPLVVLGGQRVPVEIPRRAAVVVGPASAGLRVDF